MRRFTGRKRFGRFIVEWVIGGWWSTWRLSFDEDVMLVLPFVFGVLFVSFEPKEKWFQRFMLYGNDREISLGIQSEYIHWRIWGCPSCWSSTDPRWKDGYFNWIEFFLGKLKYFEACVECRDVAIAMPEKNYCGVAKRYAVRRYYTRWPWRRLRTRIEIVMNPGQQVPCPGKGENSWDCDEDATYSMSTPMKTIEEAVAFMTHDCLRTRQRRAGIDWRPFTEFQPPPGEYSGCSCPECPEKATPKRECDCCASRRLADRIGTM